MLSFIGLVSVVGPTVTAFADADEAVPKVESPEHRAAQQFVTSLVQGSVKDAVEGKDSPANGTSTTIPELMSGS
jgi:hypothetical protein